MHYAVWPIVVAASFPAVHSTRALIDFIACGVRNRADFRWLQSRRATHATLRARSLLCASTLRVTRRVREGSRGTSAGGFLCVDVHLAAPATSL